MPAPPTAASYRGRAPSRRDSPYKMPLRANTASPPADSAEKVHKIAPSAAPHQALRAQVLSPASALARRARRQKHKVAAESWSNCQADWRWPTWFQKSRDATPQGQPRTTAPKSQINPPCLWEALWQAPRPFGRSRTAARLPARSARTPRQLARYRPSAQIPAQRQDTNYR